MSDFDIRNVEKEDITRIVFAEDEDQENEAQACCINKGSYGYSNPYVIITDGVGDEVIINSVEHANNLIAALRKAIELGWIK